MDEKHRYRTALQAISLFLPKVKDGGYMAGHDFIENYNGVGKAVEYYNGVGPAVKKIFPNKEIEIFSDSSWLVHI